MSACYVAFVYFVKIEVKMKMIHGGDVYRNHVKTDFSVNVNPLGMPKAVEAALHNAVKECGKYPDITAYSLKEAVSEMLNVPGDSLLFGNGASELFMAVVHAIKPKKTVILVPSFYGYEYAAGAADGEIIYYKTKAENNFCPEDDLFSVLTEDVDMLFFANPNNPDGNLTGRQYLKNVLKHCRDNGIYVVLDECFIEFCNAQMSFVNEAEEYSNLIIVRAFTKIFAIPGVRLGYLVCSDQRLAKKIERQLPEWNISVFAQAAGCECAKQTAFIQETVDYIKRERGFLADGLRKLDITVFQSDANFLLLYSGQHLYEKLLAKGILIRDCANFRGLSEGYYRIAVKSRKENEILLKAIGEIKQSGDNY